MHKEKTVYIISNPAWPGWYKIGITSNWKSRLSNYQTCSPFRDYKIEYAKDTYFWQVTEKSMHSMFPGHKEWVQADLETLKDTLKRLTR